MGLFKKKSKIDYTALSLEELAKSVDKIAELWKTQFDSSVKLTDEEKILNKHSIEIQFAYFDKLLYSPEAEGGFGWVKGEISGTLESNVHRVLRYKLTELGSYKSFGKYTAGMIRNHWIEFARLLGEAKIACTTGDFIWIFDGTIAPLVEQGKLPVDRLVEEDSWLVSPLLYKGDKDTIIYKIKACTKFFENHGAEEFGLYKKDENGNVTSEYITPEDLLPIETEADVRDFLNYHQTI